MIRPPSGRVGPINVEERKAIIAKSPVKGKYDQPIDSESAFEILQKRMHSTGAADKVPEPEEPAEASSTGSFGGMIQAIMAWLASVFGTNRPRGKRLSSGQLAARQITRSVTDRVAGQIAADIGKSLGGKTGSSIGRAIVRGTMGGLLRRK